MEKIIFKQLVIDKDNKQCLINNEPIALTKREYELLVFLISHPNHVYSREEIIKELWNSSVSFRAIDTTVSRLRRKLEEYGAYITTRVGFGYGFNNT